jgi:glyoxylase-like metal-dependent hydrolase (beta-lactamase superfamily II)
MGARLTRRQALEGAAAGLIAGGFVRPGAAQAASLSVTELGGDLTLIGGAGANVVVLAAGNGLLLVDGGHAAHSAALFALLGEQWPARRIEVLFNSNFRDEHIGANESARAAGAAVMAHENTKLWIGGDFFVDWEDRHYRPRPKELQPNKTFYTSGVLDFGGRPVDYLYLPRAHTDGDVAVYFRDANVLVASDLLSVGRYPVPDYATGGWIGGLIEASRALLDATDTRTRIVAADGDVYGRGELEAQLALCTEVGKKIAEGFRVGLSRDDFIASKPTAAFDAERGDPEQFLRLVYKGAFAHMRELGGVI